MVGTWTPDRGPGFWGLAVGLPVLILGWGAAAPFATGPAHVEGIDGAMVLVALALVGTGGAHLASRRSPRAGLGMGLAIVAGMLLLAVQAEGIGCREMHRRFFAQLEASGLQAVDRAGCAAALTRLLDASFGGEGIRGYDAATWRAELLSTWRDGLPEGPALDVFCKRARATAAALGAGAGAGAGAGL